MINLTKHFQVTRAQHSLLQKGLTFIPASNLHIEQKKQLHFDIQNFHRRLMLATFFENKKSSEPLPFTPKSDWTPRLIQMPPVIRRLIRANTYALRSLNWHVRDRPNLSTAEMKALHQLKRRKDIVIKPADKGNAIVILDREQYIYEATRQLNNTEYYKSLLNPIYPDTIKMIREIVNDLCANRHITYKQKQYFMGIQNPRIRQFYLLPKIHKEPSTWSIPHSVPPGRPIVSDCDSESYRITEYIEHFLNPISIRHPSYIKDSYDFINKIKDLQLPQSAFLFTIDVDSLYTNIETEAGLAAVAEWFSRYPDPKRPNDQILKLLEINLTRNDFQFNSQFYLQTKGTAMGKRFAPAYANIYMALWEETALAVCPIKPAQYFRFLDDIWGIWTDNEESFQRFIDILNNHHSSIKVKFTLERQAVNFLDTVTFKGPHFNQTGRLDIKIYFKETDTHALLHKQSFHPKHTFRGIVKSQLLRFHKICTRDEDFKMATKTLFTALRNRGYSRSFLRQALKTFLDQKSKQDKNIIPLISTFSKASQQLNRKIKHNFDSMIQGSTTLKNYKIISAYRKNKNLRDILVKSTLHPITNTPRNACPQFQSRKWAINYRTKMVYPLQENIKAQSKNCVYLISCSKCKAQYVGETQNSIAVRLAQHRYNIRNQKETGTFLVQHFLKHGLTSLKVTGLQHNPLWTRTRRRQVEQEWITKLSSKHPQGLNL